METGGKSGNHEIGADVADVTLLGKLLGDLGVEFEGPFGVRGIRCGVAAIIADSHIESNWQMGEETAVIEDHLGAAMDD
jgi:hypothetical protein